MTSLYASFIFSLLVAALPGQPANDDCTNAFALPEVTRYCSGAGGFTTAGATTSLNQEDYAVCIDERTEIKDVWFSFRATRNSVSIQVAGNVPGAVRGTLEQPQFALYGDGCGELDKLACRSPFVANGRIQNSGSLIFNELRRGEVYHVMVGARNGNEGSFELCVDQFDAVPDPSSDCPTAVVLCDKSPFAVQALAGRGTINEDLRISSDICGGSQPQENNSSWYKWTCDQAGTLSFDITPLSATPNEDIDFVVYELSNGLEDCNARTTIRQMFSGESGRGAADLVCLGKTGLRQDDRDSQENCGCQDGNNNYLGSVSMESGKSYALLIMNFTGSGEGFAIEFGGSGTFLGPDPSLVFSKAEACVGEVVIFEDQSTSLDGIASWEWDFGPNASPRTANGPGPHEVSFTEAGSPNVILAITTTRKCVEYISATDFSVICCGDQFYLTGEPSPLSCPGANDGRIELSGGTRITGNDIKFDWSSGQSTPIIENLAPGTYSVTLTDGSGCDLVDSFTVTGPDPFVFDTLITAPDCAGGTNGALEFTVLSGGAGNYTYSFGGSPFATNNRLSDLPVSTIQVIARDGNGCEERQEIFVDERQLGLVAGRTAFIEPSCNGGTDGKIDIELANGVPGFRYDFGGGYQPRNRSGDVPAGNYRINAVDSEGCTGEFDIVVTEPPLLELSVQSESSSCFGADDGSIFSTATGGRPDYDFSWDDDFNGSDRLNLEEGIYTLVVTDSNGCQLTETVILNDPEEIVLEIQALEDLTCFGVPIGSFTMTASGGSPAYSYSHDGLSFQTEPRLDSLLAGNYTLYVRDLNGCMDSLDASLIEPREFIIDVATDVELRLGADTILRVRGNYAPVDYSWGPDTVSCLNPDCSRVGILPLQSIDYFVTGVTEAGCVDTAFVSFSVIEDLPTYIPNAFSPDGDGNNDFFTVFGSPALATVDLLQVYDRWGGMIYESPEPYPANIDNLGWDGTFGGGQPVSAGVYVFYLKLRYINGRIERYKGDVTVVR